MTAAALKAAATGQVAPQEARNPYEQLRHQLEASRGEFAKLVNGDTNAAKFIRVVLNAVLANPRLLDVSRRSLMGAAMRCAQDGLLPDGRDAVLNIYNTKVKVGNKWEWQETAQYLPMVGGLIKKLYASKEITYVDAVVVHKDDHFKYRRGDNPGIEHEPRGGEDAEIVAVYAIVKLANGETKREVMWRRDIERVMAASKSIDDEGNPKGPWKQWFDQMAIKSVLKRIYKQLPHVDAFDAIERADNEAMGFVTASAQDMAADALAAHEPAHGSPPAALENQPGEVLEPTVTNKAEEAPIDGAISTSGDQNGAQAAEAKLPAGVTPPSEQELTTAVEVKMRAAKNQDALLIAYEQGRTVKDKALRLRLDELFDARQKEL